MWTHLWHQAGNFPLWLTPARVRVDADFSATPFKARIADAEKARLLTSAAMPVSLDTGLHQTWH
jgi:hypothetical protein